MRNETVIQRQEHSETDNLQKQKQNEFYQPQYSKLHTSPAERHEMTDSVNRIRFYPLNLYLCFISAFLFIYYFIFFGSFLFGRVWWSRVCCRQSDDAAPHSVTRYSLVQS